MRSLLVAMSVSVVLMFSAFTLMRASAEMVGYGPNPQLPEPTSKLVPTVNVAKALGWPQGGQPKAAAGLTVAAFATGLAHPRSILVLANADVLVAETNAPRRAGVGQGIKGWFMRLFMGKAGAGVASANRITLLRPRSQGGAEKHVLLEGLNSPFGMAVVGDTLYVANADAVVKFPFHAGETKISAAPVKVAELSAGINHHWTKSLIASADGQKLYVGIGSNSNVAENGMEIEKDRAAILEIDVRSGSTRVFASGLRNPVGMAFEPETKQLWVVVNERDELGNDLVPDYMTSVKEGAFYGWPYSYFGQHVDARVKPQSPELVAKAIAPDYALGAHTASLGLAFAPAPGLPERFASGAFVAQHGSWNREEPAGYKVIFVPFKDGKPAGLPEDVLSGFLDGKGGAYGRPVSVAVAKDGALLVVDDVGDAVWRVSGAGQSPN